MAVHALLIAGALYLLATRLPLLADFSYLLPQDAPAVRDLRRLETRIKASDTVLAIIEAPDRETRNVGMAEVAAGARMISSELVEGVVDNDGEERAFLFAHRHLFVPLADLQAARAALARRIGRAKLAANPLFIDVDAPDRSAIVRDDEQLARLQARRREAEARLSRPSNVSVDGRTALILIRAPFRATDAGRGQRLLEELAIVRDRVEAMHPGVRVGFAGGIVVAVAEHDAIVRGMAMSSLVTGLLVGLVLVLFFRSATQLGLLIGTLAVSVVITFGTAAITVGHLNAATAFLGAIIAGNGVNYGILLIARYLEERRRHAIDEAMARAITGTLRPTAIASLGASIAYGSLAATSFRGFADFAIIGAIGMMVCWIVTYVLLPVAILRIGQASLVHRGKPLLGSALVRLVGFRRPGLVCAISLATLAVAGVIVVRYIVADPFEYDIKRLRSDGAEAIEARHWMQVSDRNFGRGLSNRTYIAADRVDQVPQIVTALRARDPDGGTIGAIHSVLDAIPSDQPAKIHELAQIRTLIDNSLDALDDRERAELQALRPPDDLRPITAERLPTSLRERLAERDGRIGYLIAIRPAPQLDEWNGRDLIRFAGAVRTIELPDGETVTTSGSSVIFADIVESISRDGPVVTAVAMLGLMLMVGILVGPNRRGLAVLAGTGAGTVLMVATCALVGIRVNFLDFVALPITLGLGIDYAINIAHRHGGELDDPAAALRTSGSAVFVCSLTTIIGYASLLASDNLAIRGFGTASLIGEITCVLTALVIVPAILAVGRR